MKHIFAITLLLLTNLLFAQNSTTEEIKKIKIEDSNGNLITDSIQLANFLTKRNSEIEANKKLRFRASLNPVHLCSNNNFEEFENSSSVNVLKNFLYTVENPLNPTQCATPNTIANQQITQYDPSQTNLMASTVNSTYIDGDYTQNISFILDVKCFIGTIFSVVKSEGVVEGNKNVGEWAIPSLLQGRLRNNPFHRAAFSQEIHALNIVLI